MKECVIKLDYTQIGTEILCDNKTGPFCSSSKFSLLTFLVVSKFPFWEANLLLATWTANFQFSIGPIESTSRVVTTLVDEDYYDIYVQTY